jgi:putative DNA methylase
VNDPGYETGQGFTRGVNKKDAALERERLFAIIRDLVKWENISNEQVLEAARKEIRKSWVETCRLNAKHPQAEELFNPSRIPAFHDPFAGGGAIPLEAQRLGLESHASDLNPVAVLINKAMIEIPPKFAGHVPVGPVPDGEKQSKMHEDWSGARGLAEDVRRYGQWMRDEAENRIGHLYPKIEVTPEMAHERPDLGLLVGQRLTVIAWLWARTVRSPNPAYSNVEVPLVTTFVLSAKKSKEYWVEPVVEPNGYRLLVRNASVTNSLPTDAHSGTKVGRGGNFRCLLSGTAIPVDYIRAQGVAKKMGQRLLATIVDGPNGRIYLTPTPQDEEIAKSVKPDWSPDLDINHNPRDIRTQLYGLTEYRDLFTPRQLMTLTTFCDLVSEAKERILLDALRAGTKDDGKRLSDGGIGATAYADAVSIYLGLALSRFADRNNSLCTWDSGPTGTKSSTGGSARTASVRNLFSRQAIPMAWDYAEANPLSDSGGGWDSAFKWIVPAVASLYAKFQSYSTQADAQTQAHSAGKVISTDPPYYDNIGYADLSDFFYVWLRRALRSTLPEVFATLSVPKAEELVATPYRHGSKEEAESFFLGGMTAAMRNLAEQAHPAFPVTIYYAFKQSETKDAGTASTGWETFLAAVIRAGFALTGTWPMRTELGNRIIGSGTNALASSIILVCRRRSADAATVSRKEFLRELKDELKEALVAMLGGEGNLSPIAPVDLAQAAIGPGMAVFSKYSAVLEANGDPMSVHTALTLINKQVDEALGGENFDGDTNFCLGWFQDVGWSTGDYGSANTLAQAKATSVEGAQRSGVLEAKGGKVRLLKPADYPEDWDPREDSRTPVWEALHQLIRALSQGGETAAGGMLARMPERSGDIRRLAFWLYTLCERKGWADDARNYNELVTSWHAIEAASHDVGQVGAQSSLDI